MVVVHYQWGSNKTDDSKATQKGWVFLDFNSYEGYNLTVQNYGNEKYG